MSEHFSGHSADHFDVLVVGAGAAGLYAALCLPQTLKVGLMTKETLALSASDWAQGGIAAVTAPDDSTELHFQDTLRAGVGLCDPEAVRFLVEEASDCIGTLVEMGVAFDRSSTGELALTLEAAHSRRRVLHAADTTGRAIVGILAARVLEQKNVQVFQQTHVLNLWLDEQTGHCCGVCLVQEDRITWLKAGTVILATGGGGQVFAQTTNPVVSTGDGVAIARRAGALLRDLEFMQFHPTALTKSGAPRFLISEAVRGEGAHLVDRQGYRFAFDYHPDGELAPRDVVSRAIFTHLQRTEADPATAHVWLDLRPIPSERIQHRFPNIIQVCRQWGIDVFNEPIPVAPAAHYWMGGVFTDLRSQTTIPGLYAVGETASTGVHGANRLASNSLLECLVFGGQLAHIERIQTTETALFPIPLAPIPFPQEWLDECHPQLRKLVWQSAGICREQHMLEAAIEQVNTWRKEFAELPFSQRVMNLSPGQEIPLSPSYSVAQVRFWSEMQNLLEIADLILKSAAFRTESRGGHYRVDYPQTETHWQVHTLVQGQKWWRDEKR